MKLVTVIGGRSRMVHTQKKTSTSAMVSENSGQSKNCELRREKGRGQTSRNRPRCDSHEESSARCLHEDGRDHSAERGDVGANKSFECRRLLGFCTAEVKLLRVDFVRSPSGGADEQFAGRGRDGRGVLTLDVDGEALEEDTTSEIEDEMEPDAERARAISDSGHPAREDVISMQQHMINTEAGAWHV